MSLLHEMLKKDPREPIILDGSKGVYSFTRMRLRGVTHSEDLVDADPRWVRAVHNRYIQAGSEVIQPFTFAVDERNRADLLPDEIHRRNVQATRLARQCIGDKPILLAASIGPLKDEMIGYGMFSFADAIRLYQQQMQAVIEGGADILHVETIGQLDSAKAAIIAAQQANLDMNTRLPLTLTMNFSVHPKKHLPLTPCGVSPAKLVNLTDDYPNVVAVGANCGAGFEGAEQIMQAFKDARPKRAILVAKFNAGIPRMEGDKEVYDDATPERARRYAQEMKNAGALGIGGCCGSTPEFIHAIKKELT